jgi:SAM-dependent methyltransferase
MAFLVSKEEVLTYDIAVPDWPGEIDFYRALLRGLKPEKSPLLEVACGTGRVLLQLAAGGISAVGLDYSLDMLEAARRKSLHMPDLRWVQGNMRTFDLGERFGLIIMPGHSFQFMLTPQNQLDCLSCIRRHLAPGGKAVIHLDHMNREKMDWLGGLSQGRGTELKLSGEYPIVENGGSLRRFTAWRYHAVSQPATAATVWETLDAAGGVTDRREAPPKALHVAFRFEMEHLLARAGFPQAQVYGDFFRHELDEDSPHMLWEAQAPV